MTIDDRFQAAVRELEGEVDRSTPPSLPREPNVRRVAGPMLAFAAAVILVASFIAIPQLLGGGGGDEVAPAETVEAEVDVSAAPVEEAEPATEAPAVLASPEVAWTAYELPHGEFGDIASEVVAIVPCDDGMCAAEGFVAVGAGLEAGSWQPLAWISADGADWERIVLPMGGDGDYFIHDVAFRDGLLVAVGGIDPTANGWGRPDLPFEPMIWRSHDLGSSWELVAQGVDLVDEDVQHVIQVVLSTPEGFMAGGVGGSWTSEDGRVWQRHRVGGNDVSFDWIAPWSMGYLAWGDSTEGWSETSSLWRSRDGMSWTEVPTISLLPEDGEFTALSDVDQSSTGWLIASGTGTRPPVWRSEDGVTWEAVASELPTNSLGRLQFSTAVVDLGGGIAIFGSYAERTGPSRAIGWWTPDDGETLLPLDMPAEVFGRLSGPNSYVRSATVFTDPTSGAQRLLLVGEYDDASTVWIGEVFEP
jgi:hypothetical protein